jgi:hypothetical protein
MIEIMEYFEVLGLCAFPERWVWEPKVGFVESMGQAPDQSRNVRQMEDRYTHREPSLNDLL